MESYNGQQGASQGIIGMMDVIKSDFERTISETHKAEIKSAQDAFAFETEVRSQAAQCDIIDGEKNKHLDDAVEKFGTAEESLGSANAVLKGAINELMELKPTCVDTGMSYEERVAKREEEIEALNKALCVMNAFQSGDGAEGAGDC